ncbi:MAG: ankyrin repeat domain-containing protein [Wolbachia sp.]
MNAISSDNIKKFKGENISQYNRVEILRLAFKKDSLKVARYLVIQGIDIDAKIEKGLSFLHSAAESGCYDIVELLLNKEVEVDAKDQRGTTFTFGSTK